VTAISRRWRQAAYALWCLDVLHNCGLTWIKITFQEQTAKLQHFCQLGSRVIALKIQRVPYLYRNDENVGCDLQQCSLTKLTAVF